MCGNTDPEAPDDREFTDPENIRKAWQKRPPLPVEPDDDSPLVDPACYRIKDDAP